MIANNQSAVSVFGYYSTSYKLLGLLQGGIRYEMMVTVNDESGIGTAPSVRVPFSVNS